MSDYPVIADVPSPPGRFLVIAVIVFLILIVSLLAAVTFYGKTQDGDPTASIDLLSLAAGKGTLS